jgi:ribosomal-protein-alanine N-acetyltransferase
LRPILRRENDFRALGDEQFQRRERLLDAAAFSRRAQYAALVNTLQTGRILLEPLAAYHAEMVFQGLTNPHLYEFIAEEPPRSVDDLRERFIRLESRRSPDGGEEWLNWVVFSKPVRNPRGYVQATISSTKANIAFVLFEDAWGQGLGREAVGITLTHLRDSYGVQTASATVDPRNRRSVRLLETLGFALVKTRTGAEWIHGILTDEAEYLLPLDASRGS